MSEGAYWCLRVPNGVFGCQPVFEGAYWDLRVSTGVLGELWVSVGV